MKRQRKILFILISILLFQVSCKEEFLEPEPLSFYAPENVYINKEGFEAGLITARKDLKSEFYGNRSNLMMEYVASEGGYGIGVSDWSQITPSSGTYFPVLPLFNRMYNYIKNTNVIISRIDGGEWDSEEDRNAILSEAYFYRAWWYYRLVMTYGDVPFIGYEITGPKLDFYTHSRWTILEKLIADLEYAAQWLPESSIAGVPNKYAALHFLSKLYLANTEFDKSIEAANQVINGPYELMTERFGSDANDEEKNLLWDLHRPENKSIQTNTESILTVIDRADAPPGARTYSYMARGLHAPFWYQWVLDSEGKHGTIDDGEQYRLLGRGNPDVNQTRFVSYELWAENDYTWEDTPDLRRSHANWWEVDDIIYNNPNSVDYGKPVNPDNFAEEYQRMRIWPMPFYKTHFPHDPDYTGTPLGGNGDMYLFRLAETYLIRAEAHFWNDELGLAADDINVIRERANAPLISAGDLDIDYIFDERMRELLYEEFRHTELVRASNIMAKLNIDGYSLDNFHENNWWYDRVMEDNTWLALGQTGPITHYTEPKFVNWPIDITVITTNTLGVINQNEGFEGAQNNVPPLTEIEEEEEEE